MLTSKAGWLLLAILASGCDKRASVASTPASAARSDGFEVIVVTADPTGRITQARGLNLPDAEAAIAAGGSASLPADASSVIKLMSASMSGDQRIDLACTPEASAQTIRLAYHMGNRTFVYEYRVSGTSITPIRSSYSDLSKSSVTEYTTP